jgi:hypothetical protein
MTILDITEIVFILLVFGIGIVGFIKAVKS